MINDLLNIAHQAGQLVLSIYQSPSIKFEIKKDSSSLTEADMASHHFICNALQKLYHDIPIISEESSEQYHYDIRKNWDYFFLVDPLDGTKEFIQRNGEFTINIALIRKTQPILGIVHAPALGVTYYAEENKGAFKIDENNNLRKLSPLLNNANTIRVAVSRSHACEKTQAYLNSLISQGKNVEVIPMGSALKFGIIAEGKADIYPRLAPTMEWDIAAGHVIVNEIGKKVTLINSNEQLQYNKKELINPSFIVA